MLSRCVVALATSVVAACGFEVRGGSGIGDDGAIDAPTEGLPATCTPGETACNGRVREVCGTNHMWNPAQATTCDFTCSAGECVVDSNVPRADLASCGATAPRLAPATGAAVTLTAAGGTPHIECTPDCGDAGVTRIDPVATITAPSPDLTWFCLASLSIPTGVTLGRPSSGGPASAIAFIVDGDVTIAGTIDFDGGQATSATTGGRGAPGGYDGANLSSGGGNGGSGPCGGSGGSNSGSSDHWIGGGGGGGGNLTAGGRGGNGRCSQGNHTSNGGGGGSGNACSTAALIPLVGGSGGGSGGDGTVNVQQGWAGGGGGGALQISSRLRIRVSGAIRAAGGPGYGNSMFDGGGGGGAGGAILLEAPVVTIDNGMLIVDGGHGGMAGAGAGGAGATGANDPVMGLDYAQDGQGGSGGGGAGGRIRINATSATCPPTASPAASCSTGSLTIQ